MFGLSVKYDIRVDEDTKNFIYSKKCRVTKEMYEVSLKPTEHLLLSMGSHFIQDILPKMSAEEREFLISGLTPAEWDQLMTEMEEENE